MDLHPYPYPWKKLGECHPGLFEIPIFRRQNHLNHPGLLNKASAATKMEAPIKPGTCYTKSDVFPCFSPAFSNMFLYSS